MEGNLNNPIQVDQEKNEDSYERLHGGYRELRSKIDTVDKRLSSLLGSLIVLRWAGIGLISVSLSVIWSTCSRTTDIEKQIGINTGRITNTESRLNSLELNGSVSAKMTAVQLVDLQHRFDDFITRYDTFMHDQIERDDKQNQSLADLKTKIANHEVLDNQMQRDVMRIDSSQRERLHKDTQEHEKNMNSP